MYECKIGHNVLPTKAWRLNSRREPKEDLKYLCTRCGEVFISLKKHARTLREKQRNAEKASMQKEMSRLSRRIRKENVGLPSNEQPAIDGGKIVMPQGKMKIL